MRLSPALQQNTINKLKLHESCNRVRRLVVELDRWAKASERETAKKNEGQGARLRRRKVMMPSEYAFPIFISSTDYDLIDLRAELRRHLTVLGYQPILSSDSGFPDRSPGMEPWESCLPVLASCHVVVVAINGRYGRPLQWPNFGSLIKNPVSPTHGEYLFAHATKKRMLIFVRASLMPYYQSYQVGMMNCGQDRNEARELLSKTLPPYVDFESLEFIHQVKTSRPIPWINSFNDVTEIKCEIEKKMLNELAQVFLFREGQLEAVVHQFAKALDELPKDDRTEVLKKIVPTKELLEAMESRSDELSAMKGRLALLEKDRDAKAAELEKEKQEESGSNELLTRLDEVTRERDRLEAQINTLEQEKTDMFLRTAAPTYLSGNVVTTGFNTAGAGTSPTTTMTYTGPPALVRCDECGANLGSFFGTPLAAVLGSSRRCHLCLRNYCERCWPRQPQQHAGVVLEVCPNCQQYERVERASK